MQRHRWHLVAALGVLLGATPTLARAQAYGFAGAPTPAWTGAHPAVEGFVARVAFDGASRAVYANGVGGRVLWTAPYRTALGAYAMYTPEQGLGFSTTQLGVSGELRPLGRDAAALQPVLSLDAGALRTHVRAGGPTVDDAAPLAARTTVALALVPGAGVRLRVAPGIALRADARDLVTFHDGPRHSAVWGLGVHLVR
jgi:hypothetical protein